MRKCCCIAHKHLISYKRTTERANTLMNYTARQEGTNMSLKNAENDQFEDVQLI